MRVLVIYGSTEGHTRHLSEFMARSLVKDGHVVTLRDSADRPDAINANDWDAVIVAQPGLIQIIYATSALQDGYMRIECGR